MAVLLYLIVYMLIGIVIASVVYTIEKRRLNFWHDTLFTIVDESRYHLQSEIDDANAQNNIFIALAALIWPVLVAVLILYGVLIGVKHLVVFCTNQIIDMFIDHDEKSQAKKDEDEEYPDGKHFHFID